jgi:hypothetical protein
VDGVKTGFSKAPGSVSTTVTLLTVLGPALLTVIVYVVVVPGTTDVTLLVLAIDRSATGVSVFVSSSVSLFGFGSVTPDGGETVTVLVIEPVAVGATVPVKVNVTLWPVARLSPVHTPVPEL